MKTQDVKCIRCEQILEVPVEYVGKTVICPSCNSPVKVPNGISASQQATAQNANDIQYYNWGAVLAVIIAAISLLIDMMGSELSPGMTNIVGTTLGLSLVYLLFYSIVWICGKMHDIFFPSRKRRATDIPLREKLLAKHGGEWETITIHSNSGEEEWCSLGCGIDLCDSDTCYRLKSGEKIHGILCSRGWDNT